MIGDYLRQCREELVAKYGKRLYSKSAVARRAAYDRSTITRIESNAFTPSYAVITRLCKIYGVDKRKALAVGGFVTPALAREIEEKESMWPLIQKLTELSPEQQKVVEKLFQETSSFKEVVLKMEELPLYREIIESLMLFSPIELKSLKDELQFFTKVDL
ncbi:helix-turn-helix domain-containing protein [Alteromonas macleodii]|uniref:helix-turn-helix domain-containing protein n=1 Tax=Alteromonas macleodii TaxID=28108 RepID=UPI0036699589